MPVATVHDVWLLVSVCGKLSEWGTWPSSSWGAPRVPAEYELVCIKTSHGLKIVLNALHGLSHWILPTILWNTYYSSVPIFQMMKLRHREILVQGPMVPIAMMGMFKGDGTEKRCTWLCTMHTSHLVPKTALQDWFCYLEPKNSERVSDLSKATSWEAVEPRFKPSDCS